MKVKDILNQLEGMKEDDEIFIFVDRKNVPCYDVTTIARHSIILESGVEIYKNDENEIRPLFHKIYNEF